MPILKMSKTLRNMQSQSYRRFMVGIQFVIIFPLALPGAALCPEDACCTNVTVHNFQILGILKL